MEAGSVRLLAVLAEVSYLLFWLSLMPATTAWMGKTFGAAADRRLYHDRVRWPPRVPESVHGGHSSANVSCRSRKNLSRALSGAATSHTDAAAPHLMHHRGSSGLSGTVAFGVAGGRSGGCSMPKEVPEFLYAISPRVASAGN